MHVAWKTCGMLYNWTGVLCCVAALLCCTGPQGELSLLPAFLELALLLPHYEIELHFIGPDVPESLHKKTCRVHLHGGQSAAERLQQHTGGLCACWAGFPTVS